MHSKSSAQEQNQSKLGDDQLQKKVNVGEKAFQI